MCLILFALGGHPDYPLVLAANRDEDHGRPSAALSFWPQHPELLAGRDLLAGGTWLGLTRSGRFATVTNVRTELDCSGRLGSRGQLCLDWLLGKDTPGTFAEQLDLEHYAPFNLLFGQLPKQLHYLHSVTGERLSLGDASYGLSNACLDNDWPKVIQGKLALQETVENGADIDALLRVLADRQPAANSELPNTGLARELERVRSARFIVAPLYGTRASTVLRVGAGGDIDICERRFDAAGATAGETRYQLPAFFSPDVARAGYTPGLSRREEIP